MTLTHIPSQPPALLDAIKLRAAELRKLPQADVTLQHTLHSGIYSRCMRMPAGIELVGVLIKIPTTLVSSGDLSIGVGGGAVRLEGTHVILASANRRMALVTHAESALVMSFATKAQTLEEAEAEFTDEVQYLARRPQDTFTNTGE